MTRDEALRELGIDASAPPEEARRAYLRGIKTRKPETDPEGFRRLREAYEAVAGALVEPRAEPAPSLDTEGLEDDEEETPPELAALAARLRDLPAETHLEERLAALREAIRNHPQSVGVRWWLIQELGRAGRRGEVLEALRQGEADGLPGFLESRAANFPESIVDLTDVERLESSSSPDVMALAARIYGILGQSGKAAAVFGRAIDRVTEWSQPALRPVPEWLTHGILVLEAQGRTADSRELHHRVWDWLSGTGDAALLQRWGADSSWRLIHELGQVHLAFPPELRQEAARAALSDDAEPAVEEAKRLRKRDPKRAEQLAAMLYDLPILYDLYFRALQGVGPGQKLRAGQGRSHFSRFVTYAFLLVLLLGLKLTYCPGAPPVPTAAEVRATMHDQARGAWDGLEPWCNLKDRKLPQTACDAARRANERAQADDCPGAHTALDDMSAQLTGLTVPDLVVPRTFQVKMISALSTGCGAYELKPKSGSSP